MIYAFLAIAIVASICGFVYGLLESFAGSMADSGGNPTIEAGNWIMGISWFFLWTAICAACAYDQHSYIAIGLGVFAAIVMLGIPAFIKYNNRKAGIL